MLSGLKTIAAAALTFALCTSGVQAQNTVKIGAVYPLSGNAASAGASAKAAIETATMARVVLFMAGQSVTGSAPARVPNACQVARSTLLETARVDPSIIRAFTTPVWNDLAVIAA